MNFNNLSIKPRIQPYPKPETRQYTHSLFIPEDGIVRKVIEPTHAFAIDEAEAWAARLEHYYELLESLGVPVPAGYRVSIVNSQIIQESVNGGCDLSELLRLQAVDVVEAIDVILEASRGVLEQTQPRVGIDPQPANWCVRLDSHRLSYVDFFPVYFIDGSGETYVGFPQPTASEDKELNFSRYYTPLGLVRIIRFNFIRICGDDVSGIVEQTINKVFGDASSLCRQLHNLPVEVVRRDRAQLEALVRDFTIRDLDSLREVAALISASSNHRSFLDGILKLTTLDFRLERSIRERRFEQAKELVISKARCLT
ncbi:MAG: hypothetical protein HY974_04445 [Candidatus Kerfeldbacteria bacterium]|nr:hypothetical protein [Candidatus Kerfeldbacteria bacterium]